MTAKNPTPRGIVINERHELLSGSIDTISSRLEFLTLARGCIVIIISKQNQT